jgi:UDP-2-acetamido-2,6-beta-L-arabino-hexul-4-ose reductase
MKKVLITGSKGFVGRNLYYSLKNEVDLEILEFDIDNDKNNLISKLEKADFVFHLAGANRPEKSSDFYEHNTELTRFIVEFLIENKKSIPLVLASSSQAGLNNEYGKSKLEAEKLIIKYRKSGGVGYIYRFSNIFGKWCRPNYNSAVATFCHNIANGLDISVSDLSKELQLIHVDDIISGFKSIITDRNNRYNEILTINPTYKVTLGEIVDLLKTFKEISNTENVPDMGNDFIRKLHSTYLSYIPISEAIYSVNKQTDERGYLFELLKSKPMGQFFVSKTNPGVTRGNHYHHHKNEKFCVIEGSAVISLRHLITSETHDFHVNGNNPMVVNILPGYTHSITNTGQVDLITLFWANELYDNEQPDTYYENVKK